MAEAAKVGSWTVIGYVAPGAANAAAGDVANGSSTTNFTYTPSTSLTGAASQGSAAIGTFENTWKATAKVALNDCTTSTGIWSVSLAAASTGDAVLYTASTPGCGEALTPTFTNIGK